MSRIHGRHELGQNFLIDPTVIDAITARVAAWPGDRPLLELGAGDGALTQVLVALGRPLTAVEIDPFRVERLRVRLGRRADICHDDLLSADLGTGADIVSNVPFGITAPLLRRLLRAPEWQHSLLLLQWEVARKRAAVGGTTMLTAQWWPWFDFLLHERVPAVAFWPSPGVDGGLLEIVRRPAALVPPEARNSYQRMVGAVFAGRGRGVADTVRRLHGSQITERWVGGYGIGRRTLPRDLDAEAWAGLFAETRRTPR